MSKITRASQKIFGENSSDIVQFGSRASNSTLYTNDVGTIQSLSAWTAGWRGALISKEASLQDQNAVNFVTTSQIAYLMQQGIPEYDANTTYFTNNICMQAGVIYLSLQDNNIGNALTSTTYWKSALDLTGVSNKGTFPDYTTGVAKNANTIYQATQNGYIFSTTPSNVKISANSNMSNPVLYLVCDQSITGGAAYSSVTIPVPSGYYYIADYVGGAYENGGVYSTPFTWFDCLTT